MPGLRRGVNVPCRRPLAQFAATLLICQDDGARAMLVQRSCLRTNARGSSGEIPAMRAVIGLGAVLGLFATLSAAEQGASPFEKQILELTNAARKKEQLQ